MHGRRPVSTGALAATLAAAALFGGCRDKATTGPSQVQSKDFASALRSVSGDQQIGAVGAALAQQIVVKVVDANGLAVEGATVTFSVRSGGGSVNPPANTSASTGVVSSTWTLGTSLGANRVVATLTNGFVLDSAVFTATATSGAPALLTLVSGNTQTGRVGRALAQPLVVKLTDQYGYTKSGVRVTWTPGLSSGSLAGLTDTTAADGTAQVTWTLGTVAIPQSASASVTGLTPLGFTATAQPDTGRAIVVVSGAGQTGAVSAALATPLVLKVTDQYGNAIAGEAVTWRDSLTGGGSVSSTAGVTAADGTAQTTWTLGNRAGTQFLRAKHTASGTTFNFTATATVAFSEVLAGKFSACGIAAANQRVYCWGAGDDGQLAKGTNLSTSAPSTAVFRPAGDTLAGPFLQVRQLSGGRSQFCALTVAQTLFCWGRVFFSASVNVATAQQLLDGSQQQLFPNIIGHGEDFGCLVEGAGIAFCTGQNYSGQLGNGTLVSPAPPGYTFVVPAPGVAGALLYSRIAAGRTHACGMPRFNAADATSQTPRCWGLNSTGQVGNGTTTFAAVTSPTAITLPAGVTGFDSLSLTAGAQHTCAISTAGAGYCWGNNGFGQLGKGTGTGRDSVAQAVVMPAGVTFTKMYIGDFHSCALSTAGAAYCWGRNDYGQLGDGTRTNQPAPVAVGGGLVFRSLSLGELYTCGVVGPALIPGAPSQSAGTVYCWGDNVFGELGNNAPTNNAPLLSPTRVSFQP